MSASIPDGKAFMSCSCIVQNVFSSALLFAIGFDISLLN